MNGIIWFRNDLRTIDNHSLYNACRESEKVIGVYCLDPRHYETTPFGFKKTEKFRTKFLLQTLHELQQNLLEKNIRLLIYYGYPEQLIPEISAKYQIDTIYSQNEWTREEILVEQEIRNLITVNWKTYYDQFLFHPDDVPFDDWGKIPEVFTDFRKQLEKKIRVRPTVSISAKPQSNLIEETTPIPGLEDLGIENFKQPEKTAFPFKGGEIQAKKRIKEYFWDSNKLSVYKKTRNGLVGKNYSSKLSAWLANGSISARTIYWEVQQYEKKIVKNEDTYWLIFELIWRDYFKYISLKHGNKLFKLSGILEKEYKWNQNPKALNQWINGNTPEHFVNANMIEIQKTGWMSNRGRQNVASYWAKEWEQDWRIGAAYFESLLIDYDVHSNYGNWMYNAGVGNDPRDRKFNIKRQAELYDADGKFQKMWLIPELF
ncbi:DASH family cryptochrome [Flavobacterium sp. N2820]|uniref:DASH family cryptochrome n=1 Tax=Flavobacterium sp. N2820 TaxID=2986834 RepID=UPI00222527E2|nr:DASH family cryptochrome [Flavobacterium sp. N2820]